MMKFLVSLVTVTGLLATPALAATRPGQAIPAVSSAARASAPAKRTSQLVGTPLLFAGVLAAVVVGVVVVTRNKSNG